MSSQTASRIESVEKFISETEAKKPQNISDDLAVRWANAFATTHEALNYTKTQLTKAQEYYTESGEQGGFDGWVINNMPSLSAAIQQMEGAADTARMIAMQAGVR